MSGKTEQNEENIIVFENLKKRRKVITRKYLGVILRCVLEF